MCPYWTNIHTGEVLKGLAAHPLELAENSHIPITEFGCTRTLASKEARLRKLATAHDFHLRKLRGETNAVIQFGRYWISDYYGSLVWTGDELEEAKQWLEGPILPICGPSFPVTSEDIRLRTRNFHRRINLHEYLFGEYVLEHEDGSERVLLLHLDFGRYFTLFIYEEDCHRDCLPSVPLTYANYLSDLISQETTNPDAERALPATAPDPKPKVRGWGPREEWEEGFAELLENLTLRDDSLPEL